MLYLHTILKFGIISESLCSYTFDVENCDIDVDAAFFADITDFILHETYVV